jgi:hypothetical protein
MGIGVSIFLIAVGAVLTFAVNARTSGADLGAIGVILMVVGFIGLLATMLIWNDNGPWRRRDVVARGDREVVREREYL